MRDRQRGISVRHVSQTTCHTAGTGNSERAVFEHLALRAASTVFAFHPANGGWRSRVEAAILKGMGVKSRCPGHYRHQGRPVLRARAQGIRRPPDTRPARCPCGARCGRCDGWCGLRVRRRARQAGSMGLAARLVPGTSSVEGPTPGRRRPLVRFPQPGGRGP